jgi:predicted aconitase with swiveling domain
MVVTKADQIVISGCVISNIPLGEIVGRDIAELRNYSGRKALIKLGPEEGFLMID